MRILVVTTKKWNIDNYQILSSEYNNHEWSLITKKDDLSLEYIKTINPDMIFFIHWSHIISQKVFDSFKCILFHMTDLPYGRGGSPLQNLILSKQKSTYISAIKVDRVIDGGDVYLKRKMNLCGNAEMIYSKLSTIIYFDMIPEFLEKDLIPSPQEGSSPVTFKRRNPSQSNLDSTNELKNLEDLYDFIRMLDAETYPKAYIDHKKFRFYISNANLKYNKIIANVEIKEK